MIRMVMVNGGGGGDGDGKEDSSIFIAVTD